MNTCPVGIATQDPQLRAKFSGQSEQVINFFYYLAEKLLGYMAKLGFRTINEMIGRAEMLKVNEQLCTPKTANLDLSAILKPAWQMRPGAATYRVRRQDHKLYIRLDNKFIDESEPSLTKGLPVHIVCDVTNTDRALGTSLFCRVSKLYGEEGLPKDTIHIRMQGSAGQSCGAFLAFAPGITIELEGDANDYVGKGLSGGRLIIYPPKHRLSRQNKTSLLATFVYTVRRQEKPLFVVLPPSVSLFVILAPMLLLKELVTADVK